MRWTFDQTGLPGEGEWQVGGRRLLLVPVVLCAIALAVVIIHRVESHDPAADAEDLMLALPVSAAGTGTVDAMILGSGSDEVGGKPVETLMIRSASGDQSQPGPQRQIYVDSSTLYELTTTTADALPDKSGLQAVTTAQSTSRIEYVKRRGRYFAVRIHELTSGWHRASK